MVCSERNFLLVDEFDSNVEFSESRPAIENKEDTIASAQLQISIITVSISYITLVKLNAFMYLSFPKFIL